MSSLTPAEMAETDQMRKQIDDKIDELIEHVVGGNLDRYHSEVVFFDYLTRVDASSVRVLSVQALSRLAEARRA